REGRHAGGHGGRQPGCPADTRVLDRGGRGHARPATVRRPRIRHRTAGRLTPSAAFAPLTFGGVKAPRLGQLLQRQLRGASLVFLRGGQPAQCEHGRRVFSASAAVILGGNV